MRLEQREITIVILRSEVTKVYVASYLATPIYSQGK